MKKKLEETIPDFVTPENNCVVAAYVTNPEILARDDAGLRGVPFLFYVGTRTNHESLTQSMGKDYLSRDELSTLLEEMDTRSRLPETIKMGNEEIPGNKLATGYVPFSFGVCHESDEKVNRRIRTRANYNKMVHEILPEVKSVRKAEAKRKSTIRYRLGRTLGLVD